MITFVTQEQWDIVQEVRQHKKRVPKHMDEPNIFSGLVFCADCGKPLVLHRASTMKKAEYNFKEERLRQRRNCVAIDKDKAPRLRDLK